MRLVPFFLSLMVAGPAFAQNVSPDMVCFIQNKNGQMVDLENLCGVVPAAAPTATNAPAASTTTTATPSSLPVPTPPVGITPSATPTNPQPSAASPATTPSNIPPTAASPSTSGGSGSSGGGGSGPCNSPDDRASDGSRCGGRAASER